MQPRAGARSGLWKDPPSDRCHQRLTSVRYQRFMITALDTPIEELDAGERTFVAGIRQHGWMRTACLEEEGKPGFSFTTGFAVSTAAPESIIFSTSDEVAHETLWEQYGRAKSGTNLPIGRRTEGVFTDLPAYLFVVAKRNYRNYLGWSLWFYQGDDFPCLQIVWPDRASRFPWEPGFDPAFAADQVDLTDRGWAAEVAD